MVISLSIALATSVALAYLAHRLGALTRSGALGATLVGTSVIGFGGWAWGIILGTFFVSGSALTRYRRRDKAVAAMEPMEDGRRLGQVLANGGLAAGLAVAHFFSPSSIIQVAFLGAVAAANADTWATEWGMLSPEAPRLVTTGQRVARGTSGAISGRGTRAAAVGSLAIALFALLSLAWEGSPLLTWSLLVPAVFLAGFGGALFDSLLGATLQGRYRCATCGRETERRRHCQGSTLPVAGLLWLDNDGVNFLASAFGASAAAFYLWWQT